MLIIICVKTVKNVQHFIRHPPSHIVTVRLPSPVTCRLKLHADDDYHGSLTLCAILLTAIHSHITCGGSLLYE